MADVLLTCTCVDVDDHQLPGRGAAWRHHGSVSGASRVTTTLNRDLPRPAYMGYEGTDPAGIIMLCDRKVGRLDIDMGCCPQLM